MRFIIYRNTRVFLIVALLTNDAVNDANTKSSQFYTSNAKFASDSNKRHCFLLNEQSRKINRKIKIFLIVWFRNVKRRRRWNNIKVLSFNVIRILFRRRNFRVVAKERFFFQFPFPHGGREIFLGNFPSRMWEGKRFFWISLPTWKKIRKKWIFTY